MSTPEEIVVALNPDNLPWFLNVLLKEPSLSVNLSWHIHSSVPNEKVAKIKAFVKKLVNNGCSSNVNLRLIFQCGKGVKILIYKFFITYSMFNKSFHSSV